MRVARRALTVVAIAVLFLSDRVAAHPLDPLTPDEIRVAAEIARADARFARAQFASILLNEPSKADVIAWRPGKSTCWEARVETVASVTAAAATARATVWIGAGTNRERMGGPPWPRRAIRARYSTQRRRPEARTIIPLPSMRIVE